MSRLDVHSPIPTRVTTQPADADRVDVRGLLRAIFRRRLLMIGMVFGCAALAYFVANLFPPT